MVSPQGPTVGPLLLIIYINYLDDEISNMKKFADDTKIFRGRLDWTSGGFRQANDVVSKVVDAVQCR